MRLRRVSSMFFSAVVLGLLANAGLLWFIHQSYDKVVAAQEHRQRGLDIANRLHQETEQLGRLVRAYTATAESRYLLYYYDILAIRDGEKPAPVQSRELTYWDDVIAGRVQHKMEANGAPRSVAELMSSQGFSQDEFASLSQVLAATSELKAIEQIAFAATQGLYNPQTREFVSEGAPRLDFAGQLVHGAVYNELKAKLSHAVVGLIAKTDRRTSDDLWSARQRLQESIILSIAFTLMAFFVIVFVLRVIRRSVLRPLHDLAGIARVLASGDYSARSGGARGVEEVNDVGGALDGMALAIEQDLGQRERIQIELAAARAQAEQATQAKSMFLANMSHEIRTPMNAMIGMAYLALRTELTPRQRDYVNKIYNASRSLLGIINDILDFSKVEAGKIELENVRFRVEDVAGNALSLLRQRAQEKEIELLFDVKDPALLGIDGSLSGDALRLGQIITNLLSNAVKFTEKGHVTLSMGVSERRTGGLTLAFSVVDTGIGMSREHMARLFQEFTQADGSTTRKYGGSGLGLAISKRLVELMGGQIEVDSTPGRGTMFRVHMPFELASPRAPLPSPLPHASAMRVLIVDDQADALRSLADMLLALQVGTSGAGRVDAADDGDTALLAIEEAEAAGRPYDLLLVDWVMPRLDGAGVLRALGARNSTHRPLPVIVSAFDSETVQKFAEQLGAQHLLPKPVLPESLRNLFHWLAGHAHSTPIATVGMVGAEQLAGMHVLLAEDNQINRQLMVELMEQVGVTIETAEQGQEAIDLIEAAPADHFDVVLLDLQMPLVDGYEVARRIRASAVHFATPIIAVSAHALVEERERCRLLGVNQHISKPIDPQLLYASVAAFRKPLQQAAAQAMAVSDSAQVAAARPQRSVSDDELLLRLRTLMNDGDTEAIAMWNNNAQQLGWLVSERTASRVRAALADYDFDAALKALGTTGSDPSRV